MVGAAQGSISRKLPDVKFVLQVSVLFQEVQQSGPGSKSLLVEFERPLLELVPSVGVNSMVHFGSRVACGYCIVWEPFIHRCDPHDLLSLAC